MVSPYTDPTDTLAYYGALQTFAPQPAPVQGVNLPLDAALAALLGSPTYVAPGANWPGAPTEGTSPVSQDPFAAAASRVRGATVHPLSSIPSGRPEDRAGPSEYETPLTQDQERAFQEWKARLAPNDSGADYDLRGAFLAGTTPDAATNHWPDTFKKPNHPTFSDQSRYAATRPEIAGTWDGETFVPPAGAKPEHPFAPPPDDRSPDLLRMRNKLLGTNGEDRYQLWPERMVRSAATLPGDVASGVVPTPAPGQSLRDLDPQDTEKLVERTQDLAGLLMGGGIPAAKPGSVGVAGGKLTQPELKMADTFYSAAERAIARAPQDAMPSDQAGHYAVQAKDLTGNEILADAYPAAELPQVIGKDLANKIIKDAGDTPGFRKNYSGLDLKVGGEWATNLYDRALVSKANALGKKYGAKVEEQELQIGSTPNGVKQKVWVLPITPALRKAALDEGFPLFARTPGPVAPGATTQDTTERDPFARALMQMSPSATASPGAP